MAKKSIKLLPWTVEDYEGIAVCSDCFDRFKKHLKSRNLQEYVWMVRYKSYQ